MPPEAKTEVPDSPELAGLRQREKDLVAKQVALEKQPDSKEHDIAEARRRNGVFLAQVRAEIKRLSK